MMLALSGALETVLQPMAQALGHKYEPGRLEDSRRRPSTAPPAQQDEDPAAKQRRAEQRDAALLMTAGRLGIGIEF